LAKQSFKNLGKPNPWTQRLGTSQDLIFHFYRALFKPCVQLNVMTVGGMIKIRAYRKKARQAYKNKRRLMIEQKKREKLQNAE
jgi:hypothetical protein